MRSVMFFKVVVTTNIIAMFNIIKSEQQKANKNPEFDDEIGF